MPRRSGPSRSMARAAPPKAVAMSKPPAAPSAPAHHQPPPSSVSHAPPPSAAPPAQPSMFSQMAATAGGVAVGSAVGHMVGQGLTGLMSGGSDAPVAAASPGAPGAPQVAAGDAVPSGLCSLEIGQFLKCAQEQSDLSLCAGFNEAIRMCKEKHGVW